MRAGSKKFLRLSLHGALSAILAATAVFADDDAKTRTPTSAGAPKPGLTERERWLLDRVEQLEKRVAELEAKGNPNAATPAEAPAAHAAAVQPARAELVAGPAATASAAGVAASSGP